MKKIKHKEWILNSETGMQVDPVSGKENKDNTVSRLASKNNLIVSSNNNYFTHRIKRKNNRKAI